MWNLRTLFSLPNHKGQIYKEMLIMFCCVAFLNFSLQTLRKNMIVECYIDRIEATEFLRRGVREEVARRDVLHPVAVAPIYTVHREEVAPEVPRVNRWNRINRWNRNAAMNVAMRDYLSGKEVEC